MHIAIFLDQHLDTLGGVQSSVKLQQKYLEALGHTVTICSPASREARKNGALIATESIPLPGGGGYHFTVPSSKVNRLVDAKFEKLPPVDLVHVQADYWGAITGISFAKRHKLPSVITYHNHVKMGLDKVLGVVPGRLLIGWMSRQAEKQFGTPFEGDKADAWAYLRYLANHTHTQLTPTNHFARTLMEYGVSPHVEAMSNGLDDDMIASIKKPEPGETPVFLWVGRMSKEKRLLEYLEAVRRADVPAIFQVYGQGDLIGAAKQFVARHRLGSRVKFHGIVPYRTMVQAFASADVLVQTSIGFETQGMTVFEATTFGTPVILSDRLIAEDFPKDSYWIVDDESIEALAYMIRGVYNEIKSGNRRSFTLGKKYDYRQSTMTDKVVKVYEKTIDAYRKSI